MRLKRSDPTRDLMLLKEGMAERLGEEGMIARLVGGDDCSHESSSLKEAIGLFI